MKTIKITFLPALILLTMISSASANVDQLKTYRKVFPDLKPKCSYCHLDEKPKKEDGKHEFNAYGLKLKELMNGGELSEEMIKSIGNHEDFLSTTEATQ